MKKMINKIITKILPPKKKEEHTAQTPPTIYKIIGEEKGTYELVKNFYDIMETDPKAVDCLNSHQLIDGKLPDMIKKKLFMFLCGWLGGPNLFVEKYGHPRMRARHMHIKIGTKETEQWLYCMHKSLLMHSYELNDEQFDTIYKSFTGLALRIMNQEN